MRAQFVLSEIGVGLRRNLTMTFAVIVSVALSLALFGGSLLMRDQVNNMKGYWYDKVNVSIFLCNKADAESVAKCSKGAVTAQQKKDIEGDLKKLDIVQTVTYESADEAFKHYKEQFGDSPMAGSITPDQMQESFRVKLKDPEKFKVVATAFAGRDGVQSVQDQKGILENLFSLLGGMNVAAVLVMAVMLVVALMLIVNTVRVSAFSRRRETGIMRLVGASSFYIQAPFIMEAAFMRRARRHRRLRHADRRPLLHDRPRPRPVAQAEPDQLHRLGRGPGQAAAGARGERADARPRRFLRAAQVPEGVTRALHRVRCAPGAVGATAPAAPSRCPRLDAMSGPDSCPRSRGVRRGAALTLVFVSVLATAAVTGSLPQAEERRTPLHALPASATEPRDRGADVARAAAEAVADGKSASQAAAEAVSRSGDRWGAVYDPTAYEQFEDALDGRYTGVGLWARRTADGRVEVTRLQPGGLPPAPGSARATGSVRSTAAPSTPCRSPRSSPCCAATGPPRAAGSSWAWSAPDTRGASRCGGPSSPPRP